MKRILVCSAILAVALILVSSEPALAHSGGLDKNGCHTNRKTGDYHCHGTPSAPPAPAPTRSAVTPSRSDPPTTASPLLSVQPSSRPSAKDLVKTAQVLLRALGYQPSLLGSVDARTQEAIRAFQRAEGIEPVGDVTEYLVLRLAQTLATKCR
jgi:hypothetical protein